MQPDAWYIEGEKIIERDGDMEEPPIYVNGHLAFLHAEDEYNGTVTEE